MWNDIKSILKDNKNRCVIIEDGKPQYIVLPFLEYQQLQKIKDSSIVEENSLEADDVINEEIQAGAATVKLEDLPF